MEFLNERILGNSLLQWLIAAGALFVTVLLLRIIQQVVSHRLAKLGVPSETHWVDIVARLIAKTRLLFLVVLGVFVGALFLELPERIPAILSSLLILALLIQAGIWGGAVIVTMLESYRQRALEKDPAAVTTINVIGLVSKIVLWSTIVLVALDNLGVNITALVAGLGIGGVAVALAVQNILGDLFASLSIVLDKPFV
ncbi:MAG: mechanosensitive ion channel, partial [Granulosicoccaceae bacterium]